MDESKILQMVTKIHALMQQGIQISDITKLMIIQQQQLMRKRINATDEKDENAQPNVCIVTI